MPINQRKTTPGIPLHSEFRGGESDTIREIPPEWRAALDLKVEEIPMPWDQPVHELSDTILASKAEQQYTSERKQRTTVKPPGVFFLFESYTDKYKQLGVRQREFHFIDDWPGSVPSPSALVDVETRNFGNKHFELRTETLPGLFSAESFCSERPTVTPPDFRALLGEQEHCFVDFGIAAAPPDPLPTGIIKWCDNQETVYTHKVCITELDLLSLPKTINNKETNAKKQFVAVDRTLELDTTLPAVPTALMDVEFTKLGDGTALEIHKTVPEVFDEHMQMRERPVVTPTDFRALLTEHEESQILEGIAVSDPFPLPTGVIRHSKERQTEFTYKDSIRSIDALSLPATNLNSRTNKFKQVESVTRILELDSTVAALPTAVRDVTFTKLGDGTALEERFDVPIVFGEESFTRQRPVVTPEDFRALLQEQGHSLVSSGAATDPILSIGEISATDEQQTVFTHKLTTRFLDLLSLPAVIVNKDTNQFKQIATITRTLEVDTATPAVPSALQTVKFTKLGDGTALQEVSAVPDVFNQIEYLRERPVVTPTDFRALLQEQEVIQVLAGPAADPTLTGGQIRASDKQTTEFEHRLDVRSIDLLSLPAIIVNKDTNRYKQVETITRTLEVDTSIPLLPTALQTVKFTKLGDGTALQEVTAVPTVFDQHKWTRERPIVTPTDFRALLTEREEAQVTTGIAVDPGVPPVGVIRHDEEQVDVFTMRDTLRTIDTLSLPATNVNKGTNRFKQVETIARILELDTTTPAVPTALMDVEFTKLGDGTALEIRRSTTLLFPQSKWTRERPVVTPTDFRALLTELETSSVSTGLAADPGPPPAGVLRHEEEQIDVFNMRDTLRTIDTLSLPSTLHNKETNRFKQVVSVDRTLELATTTPAVPTGLMDVEFTMLGDGTALEIHKSITARFDEHKWVRERPVVTPTDFRALLTEKEEIVVSLGTAADPGSPPVGVIRHEEEQIDVFTMRDTLRTIDTLTLPRTNVNKETNRFKQVETVTRILEVDTTTPAVPTSVRDVEFTKLGDGTALEIRKDVPIRFDEHKWTRERPIVTPTDFRALLTEKEESSVFAGTAADPGVPPVGVLRHEQEQIDVFNLRDIIRTIDTLTLPKVNANKETNQFRQVVNVTRTLEVDTATPAAPTATKEVEFTKLGDGTALQVEKDSTTVFPRSKWTRERPIVTPSDFRALLTEKEFSSVFTGTAVDPGVPPVGVLRHEEEQLDVFNMRDTLRTIDTLSLPAHNINFETNRYKQVVTVDRFLEVDTTTPAVPTALIDVEFTKLGDGTAVEVRKSVPVLFDEKTTGIEVQDLVPEIFRAVLPVTTKELILAGTTVNDPQVLATGDLFAQQRRETAFTIREVHRGRSGITYPQTKTASFELAGERFGGEILKTVATLDTFAHVPSPLPDTGLGVTSSQVKDLGNGTWVKMTQQWNTATFWPTLTDTKYDKEIQSNAIIERQVVDPTYVIPTLPSYTTEDVVAIDKYHSRRTRTTKNVSAHNSPATALVSYRYHPFKFPGTLDYNRLITYDHREGYRRAAALLARHVVKTWWLLKSPGVSPTVGPSGSGADVEVDEIVTDTVNVPIFAPNNSTEAQTYPEVLHDNITNTLGAFYPATSPSFTEYYLGTAGGGSGTYGVAFALFPYGTGYHVGQVVSAGGYNFTVSNIGPAGELFGVIPNTVPSGNIIVTGATDLGPFTISGGGTLDVIQVAYNIPTPGSGWVNTFRTIAAVITQTDIPNLWKIVTESVQMR